VCRADDLGSRCLVFVVGKCGEIAGMGLHQDGVVGLDQRFHAGGCDANPGFMVFHSLGTPIIMVKELPRKGMLANAG